MTGRGRHERQKQQHLVAALSVAAVAIMLLAGGAWGFAHYRGQDSADRSFRTHTAALRAEIAKAADTCSSARYLFTRDIVAMEGAIQQWRIHIDAMTDLTSGKIDLRQAVAFWDSTRIEGKRTLRLFDRVDADYLAARPQCQVPTELQASRSDTATDLESCQRRQAATDVVLAGARGTLAHWKMHIKDMDALRAGKLAPKPAIRKWHQMYRRGKVELARYDADHRKLDQSPDCVL